VVTVNEFDLAVVGAGPAGMAAAVAAADRGVRVALIDAGRQLGGQYFRHPAPGLSAPWLAKLHHGWSHFERLAARIQAAENVTVLFEHQVWAVEPGFRVLTDRGPIDAAQVVLATGAYERVVPFPGWDLPGVFTAGGAQALLKGNLVLPGRRVVVAGTGPLLLPVAAGLATAGAKVLGLYEANRVRGYAKHPLPLLTNPAKLVEGLDFARQFIKGRVPVHSGRMVIEAQGTDSLEAVVVARPDGGARRRVECDTLAIGYGLAPQIDLALTLGAEHEQLSDGTIGLRVDTAQRTSVPGLYAAGETVGVGGVQTALAEGEIAGIAVARALARRDSAAASPRTAYPATGPAPAATLRRRARTRALADLLCAQHPIPAAWRAHLTPDTLVCRCEEVPVSAIAEAVDLGAADSRTVKLLTRAGMGWCQGRVCGHAVACLARLDPAEPPAAADLLAAAKRPLARPVPLGVLAAQDQRNK
jgi:NADPH-dependent 2,4-dienoyl-CoA reductase/sulfur reductase-like enzyme